MSFEELDQINLIAIDLLESIGYNTPSEEQIYLTELLIRKLEQSKIISTDE